jgi:glycosyltransferase involved in cell wall biosynthesis
MMVGMKPNVPGLESVSVVIPTYNRAGLVQRAINSVLAGMSDGDELLVVDDGSTDDTLARLSSFGTSIRVIAQSNRGQAAARNVGLLAAKHDLVAFLDSDDEWTPDKLDLQRALFATDPDLAFACSDFGQVWPDGQRQSHYLVQWHGDNRSWDDILGAGRWYSEIASLPSGREDFRVHFGSLYRAQLRGNYVSADTVVVRKRLVLPGFFFDEDFRTLEDCAGFSRLARQGRCAYLDCDTSWQYTHAGPRASCVDPLLKATIWLEIIDRNWGSDPQFLVDFGEEVAFERDRWRRQRVRYLLIRGRRREALPDLSLLRHSMTERLAALVPPPFLTWLMTVRRRFGQDAQAT